MKIGIISDIHGNDAALQAVLRVLEHHGAQRIVCAGDVVGYGPRPSACIHTLRTSDIDCVRGNHDQYTVLERHDALRIQPEAREVIRWTRDHLSAEELDWLENLPMVRHVNGFALIHASHVVFPRWPYIVNENQAMDNFLFQRVRLAFNGHTHVPLCVGHDPGGRAQVGLLRNMFLPRRRRLLIGVGSVGQPRDGDPRASCVLYDTDHQYVRLLRVEYDIAVTQQQIRDAGLPHFLAERLSEGR